jgi:predicted TIM-barrel fold metal-dependent hydrolase
MVVIDADAHVEECEATWQYLDPEFHKFRPIPVSFPEDTCFGSFNGGWIIDYKLRLFSASPTSMKVAHDKGIPIGVQEVTDVPARVTSLDAIGVDKQVIFPSLWLGCLAENVALEAALARSYNEFMATQCGQANGRLWYAAVIPFRDADLAVAEIRRVKQLGAAASIFARGLEWDRPLTHPAMRPIFAEAERQDLPITVHTGNGSSPTISRFFEGLPRPPSTSGPFFHPLGRGLVSGPYVEYAFEQLLGSTLLDEFPRLRVAFLEAGSDWTVHAVKSLRERRGPVIDRLLGERVFVSCSLDDDLPYVVDRLGDDFLITATDYPHIDAFRQDYLASGLHAHDLGESAVAKILGANPARLYALA